MKKFLLLTVGFDPPTPEDMALWNDWFASLKDVLVKHEGLHAGKEVTKDGVVDLPFGLEANTGYMIIEAESLDEAVGIAKRGPIVTSTRVYEIRSM
ncbi:MAG: hypothetical protein MUO54_10955 [Anaerolineales bacterium]|nr:hypothetical protein [Anaerolineales bacterium]